MRYTAEKKKKKRLDDSSTDCIELTVKYLRGVFFLASRFSLLRPHLARCNLLSATVQPGGRSRSCCCDDGEMYESYK